MKMLITGGKGMLGRTLEREFSDFETVIADLPGWDITDDIGFAEKVVAAAPDVIIHCAAMTKVDDCENERELAFRLNETGSRNVALAAKMCSARLIAISTDYVFPGEPPAEPWAWSEGDLPRPETVYGQSKLAGERMIQMIAPDAVILRVAWLYGAGGPSFVHTMAKLGSLGDAEPIKVVDDQIGNPTSARTVAGVIRYLIGDPRISGVVHGTCEERASWYEFACEIKRLVNLENPGSFSRAVEPCSSDEFPRPAPRPKNSALKKSVLNVHGYRTPSWRQALEEFVKSEFSLRRSG